MNKHNKIIYLLASIVLLHLLSSCRKEKTRICSLYKGTVAYAIGTIDKYVSAPGKVTYTYSFKVDGGGYKGKEKGYGIGQKDERMVGRSFVVVYDPAEPSNNDLNTDFPIDSDPEFEQFKTDHLNQKPSPDFPNKCK